MTGDLLKVVKFINEVEKLKSVLRSGNTSIGRKESTADHTWRLSLLTMLMSDYIENCDPLKLIQLTIVHDLGELDEGDIPAVETCDEEEKFKIESSTMRRVSALLPGDKGELLYSLWMEYEEGLTAEAKVVKALDKIETIIQHNQVDNGETFDYEFNLNYGNTIAIDNSCLSELRRIVDEMTKENVK